MSEKPAHEKTAHEEELTKLHARIRELEHQVRGKGRSGTHSTAERTADSWSNGARSAGDTASRMFRGATLASVEGVRLFADTISVFADSVVSRNESRENRSVRDLTRRLPEDMFGGMADAMDTFADIPGRTADRFSQVYREGEKTEKTEKT